MSIRKDIRLSPEWDVLEFVDGYRALIRGARIIMKNNIDYIRYYLYPTEELLKRYDIIKDMVDEDSGMICEYPKDMIVILNEDDPSRKVKFCYLNFEGKRTPTTEKLLGAKTILDGDVDVLIGEWAKENKFEISQEEISKLKNKFRIKFRGISEPDEMIKLKKKIYELMAENAHVKEENFIAKTNMAKYIEKNFSAVADAIMPIIRKGIEVEKAEMEAKVR